MPPAFIGVPVPCFFPIPIPIIPEVRSESTSPLDEFFLCPSCPGFGGGEGWDPNADVLNGSAGGARLGANWGAGEPMPPIPPICGFIWGFIPMPPIWGFMPMPPICWFIPMPPIVGFMPPMFPIPPPIMDGPGDIPPPFPIPIPAPIAGPAGGAL